jgi:hypothetical protein
MSKQTTAPRTTTAPTKARYDMFESSGEYAYVLVARHPVFGRQALRWSNYEKILERDIMWHTTAINKSYWIDAEFSIHKTTIS